METEFSKHFKETFNELLKFCFGTSGTSSRFFCKINNYC